ncbi:MAG: flagellar brake protein [Dechloromonas sp.]|uniref:Flagellar brake protein n=1 Tax=Candidatus Dechloromonas phosphorivorans TaxID=2899244 RepID=A0A935K4U8_9RHOO|nr:flagellar brake protein [Candidatus Dechloromonas phosphorivorans]
MAIDEQAKFVKVGMNDLEVGKPLAHPFYDGNRRLLLKRGYVVESIHQCELLVERGLYRNVNERSAPANQSSSVASDAPASRETITTLDATKIRIGDPLTMQKSSEDPRLVVKLIGYVKNRGLIVTVPGSDGEFVMLKEGQSFVCRFFSGQNAYAFTTTVAKQTSVPFPHLHLSYPREVRGLEIRKGSRIDVELIAAISSEGDGEAKSSSGKIINISTGGGALRAKQALGEKGDLISVKFKITVSDIQSFIVFDSIIRTVSLDNGDPNMPYLHGLQFIEPDQNMAMALAAFVYQRIVDEAH